MTRLLPPGLILSLLLGACASPSPPMMTATVSRVSVAGHDFTVRHNGHRAEAVRTSLAASPRKAEMLLRAREAMQQASGCAVRPGTLYGDAVLSEAFLDCPDRPGAALQPRWVFTPPR